MEMKTDTFDEYLKAWPTLQRATVEPAAYSFGPAAFEALRAVSDAGPLVAYAFGSEAMNNAYGDAWFMNNFYPSPDIGQVMAGVIGRCGGVPVLTDAYVNLEIVDQHRLPRGLLYAIYGGPDDYPTARAVALR